MTRTAPRSRRFHACEVVQTSAMDCGPASLCSFLQSFGYSISYERMREVCQTDVDGTSIDTLEEIARSFGVPAEQNMLPACHLPLKESGAVPAIILVRQPDGMPHFVVIWRSIGPFLQIMDPGFGRRWTTWRAFLRRLLTHKIRVAPDDWREWAGSEENLAPVRRRLAQAGLGGRGATALEAALADPDWESLGRLDAALSLVQTLIDSRVIKKGDEASAVLHRVLGSAGRSVGGTSLIPDRFWQVRPREDGDLTLQGAVLIRVAPPPDAQREGAPETGDGDAAEAGKASEAASSGRSFREALETDSIRPMRQILGEICRSAGVSLPVVLGSIVLAACGVIIEALLLRGILEAGLELEMPQQRISAVGFFLAFSMLLLLLELRIAESTLRLGRQLDVWLRQSFLGKIPRLPDRYFQSRPVSDMAERAHAIYRLREFPMLTARLVRTACSLLVTALAIAWVDPDSALLALSSLVATLAVVALSRPAFQAINLKLQTHKGVLASFYLDVLIGLAAVRSHRAERTVMREHEDRLVEWANTGRQSLSTALLCDAAQLLLGYALAFAMIHGFASRDSDPGRGLLLAFWALMMPRLGNDLSRSFRELPSHEARAGRLLEPLAAAELDPVEADAETLANGSGKGVDIRFEGVTFLAAGHVVLNAIDLRIAAGEQIAVVGPSGAGKSSLIGILLGWNHVSSGRVRIDGRELSPAVLDALRHQTAWIDPGIQLWNRSLLENIRYGRDETDPESVSFALREADLLGLLESLPEGLQTPLGESGGLLSGGEGQRVRLGRAMQHRDARLVLLDEPFRGLDRGKRDVMLERVRAFWPEATLLCTTHDLEQATRFDRVIVVAGGKIAEDAHPDVLLARPDSIFRRLLEAEAGVRARLLDESVWRRIYLHRGKIIERSGEAS